MTGSSREEEKASMIDPVEVSRYMGWDIGQRARDQQVELAGEVAKFLNDEVLDEEVITVSVSGILDAMASLGLKLAVDEIGMTGMALQEYYATPPKADGVE